MPTLRCNPLSGEWVLIAPDRFERPHALQTSGIDDPERERCPFCPGNEADTPPEICRVGTDERWEMRVVPNKYAAVELLTESMEENEQTTAREIPAIGSHEVIVESYDHDPSLRHYAQTRLEQLIRLYHRRYETQMVMPETRSITIFKNSGRLSSASLRHPHSQLVTLPIIPARGLQELDVFSNQRGACPLCKEAIRAAREDRIIARNDRFQLLAPWAPRHPFQTWIVSRKHTPCFSSLDPEDIEPLAELLHLAVSGLDRLYPDCALNWSIQSSPLEERRAHAYFHWYLEIFPRLTLPGGFEWSTGGFINIVTPERAATELRHAIGGISAMEGST